MNANCPKCQQQTTFVSVENKKYKCENCNTVLYKCHKDGCINMIPYGWYCSKCVGQVVRDIKAGAITVVVGVVVGVIANNLLDDKGKKQ